MSRPVVGLTTASSDGSYGLRLREEYVRAVEEAGGVAVLLPPGRPEEARGLAERMDGLLLTGGGDVDPALYGCPPHRRLGTVDRPRDLFEIELVVAALALDLPLLAICRGVQLLNVATGGTLHQDIPSELGRPPIIGRKRLDTRQRTPSRSLRGACSTA